MLLTRLFVLCISLIFLVSCVARKTSVAENSRFAEFIGYEFSIDEPCFLAIEKTEYHLLKPGAEGDSIRDFIGAPTIKSFLNGNWDISNYKGSFKYIDVIPNGTVIRIVDVVERRDYVIGITYNYYAKIIDTKKYNNFIVNINGFIFSDFRKPLMRK